MDPNFCLIKHVNPSKSASKIKECFAKLTLLSSRKKMQPEAVTTEPEDRPISPPRSNTIRKLFDDFLTDDESDTENEALNRIFRTKTTTTRTGGDESGPSNPARISKSFSQRLEVSDSDETNCSIECGEKIAEMQSEMEKLEISQSQEQRQSSQQLFTDSQHTTEVNAPIEQISSRLSSLEINSKTENAVANPPTGCRTKEEDRELENIFLKQKEIKAESENRRISVLTISSTHSNPDSLDDSDVVIISESETESDYSYPVSSIKGSDYAEPSNVSGTMAERLDAFFNNIPLLASGEDLRRIVAHNEESENSRNNDENSVENDEIIIDESIEICGSSAESGGVEAPRYSLEGAPLQAVSSPRLQLHKLQTPPKSVAPKKSEQMPKPVPSSPRRSPRKKPQTPREITPPPISTPKKTPQTKPQTPRKTATPKAPETTQESQSPHSPPPPPTPPPAQPLRASDSDSNSSECRIEKINISATFKIKLKISDMMVASVQSSFSSTNTPRLTESSELPSSPSSAPPPDPTEEEVRTPENQKQRSIRAAQTPDAIDLTSIETPPPPQQHQVIESENEIDEAEEKLLNQLYGDEWKTPDVVKTLKKANTSRIALQNATILPKAAIIPKPLFGPISAEESLMNFSNFHCSIRSDLESTRLPGFTKSTTKTPGSIFKVPLTDRKVVRSKKPDEKRAVSEKKTMRTGRNVTATIKNRCDGDSSDSNGDFNASSDDSWKNVFSYSSDSDNEPATFTSTRKTTKKTKPKNSSKDKLVYLDLSSDVIKVKEIDENTSANTDNDFLDRIKKLLETCKAPDKPKIEATPKNNPKTKRKLFTPRFGEEDEASPIKPDVVFNYKENDSVTLKAPLPGMFEPINKQLESVKSGKPIFAIKTPKTISKKNKENSPLKNSASPALTPMKTPKGTCKKSETLSVNFQQTPSNKYGFLQSLDVMVSKNFCHPDAVIYKENYKAKKEELAEKLNAIYKEKVFNGELEVSLTWNKKLLNTAGRCSCCTKSGKRFARIELSDKVLTSADRLRCTLIHELCHAATWIYNGEHGHGVTWKKWARRANAIFPELPKIGVCHNYDIDYKYTYKCTLCAAKSHAHSKSKKVENIRCSYCLGAIEVFLNKKDKDGNVVPTPVKEPTGFAKFVKDNYKKHKRTDLNHAEVMKILSNEFSALKA